MGCINMNKYFQVVTPKGELQIDDTYKNLELIHVAQSVSVYRHTYKSKDGTYSIGRDYGAQKLRKPNSIGAIASNGINVPFIVSQINNEIRVYTDGAHYGESFTAYEYAFGNEKLKATWMEEGPGHVGLQVINADGRIIYSSDRPYIKVVKTLSGRFKLRGVFSPPQNEHELNVRKFTPLLKKEEGHRYALLQGTYPYFFYDYDLQGHHAGVLGVMETETEIGLMPINLGMTGYKDIDCPKWMGPEDDMWRFVSYTIIDVTEYSLNSRVDYTPEVIPEPKPKPTPNPNPELPEDERLRNPDPQEERGCFSTRDEKAVIYADSYEKQGVIFRWKGFKRNEGDTDWEDEKIKITLMKKSGEKIKEFIFKDKPTRYSKRYRGELTIKVLLFGNYRGEIPQVHVHLNSHSENLLYMENSCFDENYRCTAKALVERIK